MFKNAQSTEHGKDEELVRHAVPPAEARRARDDLLAAFTAEALEELVDDQASTGPGEAAAAVELPPLRLEDTGHGCSGARRRRCENTAQASRVAQMLLYTRLDSAAKAVCDY